MNHFMDLIEEDFERTDEKPILLLELMKDDEFKQLIIIAYFCTSSTDSIILSNEHIDYKWVLPDKLLENVCDNIRPTVAENLSRIKLFAEAEKNLQRI